MPTIHQLVKTPRVKKKTPSKSAALEGCPQKKGVCLRVYVRSQTHYVNTTWNEPR
jgi:small subunit ribosomal protein S12